MKVLYVIDNLQKGGKERRLLELLRYWEQEYDIDSTLVLLRDKIEYPDVNKLKKTSLIIIRRKIKKDPLVLLKLWKICRSVKPDIIHTWGSQPAVYMCLIALFQRIPFCNSIIVNAKCDLFSKDWIRSRLSFPFSTKILANSQAGLDAYKVTSNKGIVIYNGYNFDRNNVLSNPALIRRKFEINSAFIVGMVGSFHRRKDYDTLVRAAAKIHQTHPDITFLCIGDGERLREMIELNQSMNLHHDKVLFTGKQNEIESLIQIMDVGLLLTNTLVHQEGISNSIIEYMAQKKPVIATFGGGTNEVVANGRTGILIKAFDADGLVGAIISLYSDKKLRFEMGEEGYSRIRQMFSIDQMVTKTFTCYNEIKK